MVIRGSTISGRALGAAVGIAYLFISASGTTVLGADAITQADARAKHPVTPASHAGVSRRTSRRAPMHGVVDRTIDLGWFGSRSVGAYYGYAPGTYGGLGCFRSSYGDFVCP